MAMTSFQDKVVWITGGGSGIGRALAQRFFELGAKVVISGRREDKLAEAKNAIGSSILCIPCDVTDEAQVQATIDHIIKAYGQLDVAVANAGFGVNAPFIKITAEQWRRQLDVNVIGAATTVRLAWPHILKAQGRFALIASVAGRVVFPGSSAYSASKFALRAMGLSISQELHNTGASCTVIHPGFVESDINLVDNSGVLHESRQDFRPQKLTWSSARAAKVMVDAIAKRKREFTFTKHGVIGGFIGHHFPGIAHFAVTRSSKLQLPSKADY